MKSLFEPDTIKHIEERLNKLSRETRPLWGRMNSAQMMAHSVAVMQSACDDAPPAKQMFLGKVFMLFMKDQFWNDKPYGKNAPTSPDYVMATEKDFEKEKQRLLEIVRRFHAGGPQKITPYPSIFWGKRPADQWGMGMYKHLDHHFQQFGI